jgi:hypothetical protein
MGYYGINLRIVLRWVVGNEVGGGWEMVSKV